MTRIDLQEIRRAAFGQWHGILIALGIPASTLTKKNKPCPCCGGTDRFSFIDQGQGRFVCRSLDRLGGDGFTLVMHWLGRDFKTALEAVAGVLGLSAGVVIERTSTLFVTPAQHRDHSGTLRRIWSQSQSVRHSVADTYLHSRGLALDHINAAVLRYHPALDYWIEQDSLPMKIGTYPALLALVMGPNGEAVGIHRIYLTSDGQKARPAHPITGEALDAKKLLTIRDGAMRGAAIRLYEPEGGTLALAEGIETALAVRLGSGLPCWAAVSAWGLENIILPESVTDLHIMADNDASGTGQHAAERLAKKLLEEGRRVRIHTPSMPGTDWLDVFNEKQKQENAA